MKNSLRFTSKKGFTLIELLVVIAIIGLLSTLAIVALSNARAKARDAKRMHDLSQIRTAMLLYYDNYNNYIESGSGCGYNGNGQGWFNYTGGSYPKSIAQCLVDAGLTPIEIIDPTGGKSSNSTSGYAYMKYHCGTPRRVFIYAKLETIPQSSTATDGTCCTSCDSSYGMNYYLQVQ
jgi:prepilin-type N-terminal cleavage/methylation domain-containing protein